MRTYLLGELTFFANSGAMNVAGRPRALHPGRDAKSAPQKSAPAIEYSLAYAFARGVRYDGYRAAHSRNAQHASTQHAGPASSRVGRDQTTSDVPDSEFRNFPAHVESRHECANRASQIVQLERNAALAIGRGYKFRPTPHLRASAP